jgi:hypothetical protein
LCIFGDNAYLNTPYIATPYQGTWSIGIRDSYNFFHSQLRIHNECFGMFTMRWGMLQKAIPVNVTG